MSHEHDNATAYEIKAAVDDLARAFEDHKETHAQLEASQDPLLEEKLQRIDDELGALQRRLDQLARAAARPALAGTAKTQDAGAEAEHKSAFYDRYIRKGLERDLAGFEAKALNIGVDAEGGFAVPESLDREVDRLLTDISPIRTVAKVVEIGSANYKKLVTVAGTASGWVGETGARPETASPQFAEVAPPLGEIYANPAATQAMLDDGFFDVEAWLAEELAIEFGAKEGAAFVNGDGINKPKGFLTYPTAATGDGVRPFGTIEHVATGVAGGFPASNPADKLVDLVHALRPAYRQGAVFVMNTNTVAAIRKFKDADGNYLWRPGLSEAASASLLGYPVVEAEDMPDIGADSLSVAFGNFSRGYTVTDRLATRILRDPFSNKPFVHFYATKRVGGGVVNSQAIKFLKFALS
ncbi:MAG: phage major capsid protein [Alphaproteobacteria bacterium]|nr:MAG: phage major capsid protein [Alphaproteobacteria bacterium]